MADRIGASFSSVTAPCAAIAQATPAITPAAQVQGTRLRIGMGLLHTAVLSAESATSIETANRWVVSGLGAGIRPGWGRRSRIGLEGFQGDMTISNRAGTSQSRSAICPEIL